MIGLLPLVLYLVIILALGSFSIFSLAEGPLNETFTELYLIPFTFLFSMFLLPSAITVSEILSVDCRVGFYYIVFAACAKLIVFIEF